VCRSRGAVGSIQGMARIDREQVLHVARLARLSLTDQEVQELTEQLEAILDHASRIDALDTEGVRPTAHPLDVGNVWRDDEPEECLTPDRALANAPREQSGQFGVPPP
jgi:aspartyl-tRNA(Asn)/glutamyl-tRNA(Gln) amidotransferase subunit C